MTFLKGIATLAAVVIVAMACGSPTPSATPTPTPTPVPTPTVIQRTVTIPAGDAWSLGVSGFDECRYNFSVR